MTFWIILAIIGNFLNSVVALIDKFLVTSKKVPQPILYVFYTGILTIFTFLIYVPDLFLRNPDLGLPSFSNIYTLNPNILIIGVLSALSMLIGLYCLFTSLKDADASDVFPVIGSFSAFFVLLLSYFFFDELLKPTFFFAFIFLVLGTLLVSHFRFDIKTFYLTLSAALFLGVQNFLLKVLFNKTNFDSGLFWFSVFMVTLSILMLFNKKLRFNLFRHRKSKNVKKTDRLVLMGKIVAGIAGLMITKAIALGNVSIVQSMTGLQYLFLFLFALLLGPKTNVHLGENVTKKDILQKFVSTLLILVGFVLLFM